jgi:hypothetical protein
VVAGTKCEGVALASVRTVGVGSHSHCGGGLCRRGRCSGHCSLGRREHSQPLLWRARQVRALLWPPIGRRGLSYRLWRRARKLRALLWRLFPRSAWAQPATVLVDTTVEGASLASFRLVGVGTGGNCGGWHDR